MTLAEQMKWIFPIYVFSKSPGESKWQILSALPVPLLLPMCFLTINKTMGYIPGYTFKVHENSQIV